jgi:hypothetical protein
MEFGYQQANFLRDTPDAVAQAVVTRLKLWLGEWFIDQSEGTPYQQAVLGKGTQQSAEPAIRSRILETQGVKSILSFAFAFDGENRIATINATIDTIYGQATVVGIM